MTKLYLDIRSSKRNMDLKVVDEIENPVYFLYLHYGLNDFDAEIQDENQNQIANMYKDTTDKKFNSYITEFENGQSMVVKKSESKNQTIEVNLTDEALICQGDLLNYNFDVVNDVNSLIASVTMDNANFKHRYEIDIKYEAYTEVLVAMLIAIINIINVDRAFISVIIPNLFNF